MNNAKLNRLAHGIPSLGALRSLENNARAEIDLCYYYLLLYTMGDRAKLMAAILRKVADASGPRGDGPDVGTLLGRMAEAESQSAFTTKEMRTISR